MKIGGLADAASTALVAAYLKEELSHRLLMFTDVSVNRTMYSEAAGATIPALDYDWSWRPSFVNFTIAEFAGIRLSPHKLLWLDIPRKGLIFSASCAALLELKYESKRVSSLT